MAARYSASRGASCWPLATSGSAAAVGRAHHHHAAVDQRGVAARDVRSPARTPSTISTRPSWRRRFHHAPLDAVARHQPEHDLAVGALGSYLGHIDTPARCATPDLRARTVPPQPRLDGQRRLRQY
jgi:hypothetical protein